jgi:regulatory protein
MDEKKTLERATSLALRYISYRPRSEFEVRGRLRRRYDEPVADLAIERLKEMGLLDDKAFALAWSQGRLSFKPRSAALIRRELLAKGIDRETVLTTVEVINDEESAYNAGRRSAKSLAGADYTTFRRRLWGYLQRRGYSQSIVRKTVDHLWEERGASG